SIIPDDHGLVCPKCWKVKFHAKPCTCAMETVEGIGRRNKSEEEWKLQVISEEIPCPLNKGDCNNGETDPSKMGLAEALRGDSSTHIGKSEMAEKARENPKKTIHVSKKVDSESSEWKTGSEDEESVENFASEIMDENRQSIFNNYF
ncbi:hypothetical protein KI387_036000, partial [Taxus chinensis]